MNIYVYIYISIMSNDSCKQQSEYERGYSSFTSKSRMHLLSRCKNIDDGRIIALNLKREREKRSSPPLHKYPRFFFERFSNYSWIPFLLYTRRKTENRILKER